MPYPSHCVTLASTFSPHPPAQLGDTLRHSHELPITVQIQHVQISPVQVIGQINGNEHTSGRWIDTHVVCSVVQELGSCIALDIMGIVISPAQLDIYPVLLSGGAVHHISKEKASQNNLILHKTLLQLLRVFDRE